MFAFLKDADYRAVVRRASAKTFGLQWSALDRCIVLLLGLSGAVVPLLRMPMPFSSRQVCAAALGFVFAASLAYVIGLTVPFFLNVRYSDVLRVRVPYYLWWVCGVGMLVASDSYCSAVAAVNGGLGFQRLTLFSCSLALSVRFLQRGGFYRLYLSALLLGVQLALSFEGVFALVALVSVKKLMLHSDFEAFVDGENQADNLPEDMSVFLRDAAVAVRVNRSMFLSVLVGVFVTHAVVFLQDGGLSSSFDVVGFFLRRKQIWMQGLRPTVLAVSLGLIFVPIVFVLKHVHVATDLLQPLSVGKGFCFLFFGALSAAQLVLPRLLSFVPDSLTVYVLMSSCFVVMLSAMVMLIDAHCRKFKEDILGNRRPVDHASMVAFVGFMTILPVLLLAFTVFGAWLRTSVRVEPVREAPAVVEANMPDQHNEPSANANESIGRFYLGKRNYKAAIRYFERALLTHPEDVDILELAAKAYEGDGDAAKARELRQQAKALGTH